MEKKLDSSGVSCHVHIFPLQFLIDLRICRVCVETTTNRIWQKYAMFSPRLVIYYYWEKGERSCVGRIGKKLFCRKYFSFVLFQILCFRCIFTSIRSHGCICQRFGSGKVEPRIRIHFSQMWIPGSGSTSKCDESEMLIQI